MICAKNQRLLEYNINPKQHRFLYFLHRIIERNNALLGFGFLLQSFFSLFQQFRLFLLCHLIELERI